MTPDNQTQSKQVDNAQNRNDDGAVSSSDNNTDTDTDPPGGRGIKIISKETPIKKSSEVSDIQGGPDTDPPNS